MTESICNHFCSVNPGMLHVSTPSAISTCSSFVSLSLGFVFLGTLQQPRDICCCGFTFALFFPYAFKLPWQRRINFSCPCPRMHFQLSAFQPVRYRTLRGGGGWGGKGVPWCWCLTPWLVVCEGGGALRWGAGLKWLCGTLPSRLPDALGKILKFNTSTKIELRTEFPDKPTNTLKAHRLSAVVKSIQL